MDFDFSASNVKYLADIRPIYSEKVQNSLDYVAESIFDGHVDKYKKKKKRTRLLQVGPRSGLMVSAIKHKPNFKKGQADGVILSKRKGKVFAARTKSSYDNSEGSFLCPPAITFMAIVQRNLTLSVATIEFWRTSRMKEGGFGKRLTILVWFHLNLS